MVLPRPLTSEEQTLLLSEPQSSKIRVLIDPPPVVFACQVNQTFTTFDQLGVVGYDSVSTGVYTDVIPGMTCYVGTEPGLWDLGVVRVRDMLTSSEIPLGENSDVFWADNVYLTVVDDFFFWTKHPLTQVDGSIKMDYDVEYSNQHSSCKPVVVMGSDVVRVWEDTAIGIRYDCSNSWSPTAGSMSVVWACPGASISSTTSQTPMISFSSPGRYRVSCTVTIAGISSTSYRYAFIRRVDEFVSFPFTIQNCSGDRQKGGWGFSIRASGDDLDVTSVREGSKVIVISDDYYGSSRVSIGPQTDRENIVVLGWIAGIEPISGDLLEGGEIEFSIEGPQYWIDQLDSFVDEIESIPGTPDNWLDFQGLTLLSGVWHLVTWRSTISLVIDIFPPDDLTGMRSLRSDSGSLWQQIIQNASRILAYPCCDRVGRLFVEIEQQLVAPDDRTGFPEILSISSRDWQRPVRLERRTISSVSQVTLSGTIHIDGSTGQPIFSLSSGHTPKRYGRSRDLPYLALTSQSQANQLAGLALAWYNVMYEVEVDLGYHLRMIDICPSSYVGIVITPSDTPRRVTIDSRFVPRQVDLEFDLSIGSILPKLLGEIETFPENSVDGDIPATDDSTFDFDVSFPPMAPFPPLPPLPVIPLPPIVAPSTPPSTVVFASSNFGIGWTSTFDQPTDSVVWNLMNTGLSPSDLSSISHLVVTPGGALYCVVGGGTKLMRAGGLGGSWVQAFDASYYSSTAKISGLGVNPTVSEEIAFVVGNDYVFFGTLDTSKIFVGSRLAYSAGGYVQAKFNYYQKGVVFWKNNWIVVGHRPTGIGGSLAIPRFWRYTPSGTLAGDAGGVAWGSGPGSTIGDAWAQANTRLVVWGGNVVSDYVIIDDLAGSSQTEILTGPNIDTRQGMSISPTELAAIAFAGSTQYLSSDSLATWTSTSGVLPSTSKIFENCRDDFRFIVAGGSQIGLTMDFGTTYDSKVGNLPTIATSIILTLVRYIR